MPDSPFNNAFVAPDALGYEEVSVIPAHSTLDFTTLFGLPPDPGLIACHELAHYVHVQQTAGLSGGEALARFAVERNVIQAYSAPVCTGTTPTRPARPARRT